MMHWQYNPYVLPLVITAAISAALALSAWRRRPAAGATSFVWLMLAVAEWSLGYALELGTADLPTALFWARVEYLGMVMVPATLLVFVLQYTGREKWLTRRNLALLAIEPLVTLLLVWTNEAHGLIYSHIEPYTNGSLSMLDETFGAWAWVDVAYSYLLILLGTLLLIQALIRSPRLYRRQVGTLLIGAFAPWAAEALSISGLSPFPHLDLTPFAFTLTGLAMAWGLLRFRFLDIVPVARDAVIEGMGDGVIVLDVQNRIVDLNPAAQRIIGRAASEAIGQPAAQVLSGRPDLVERYRDVREAHAEIVLGEGEAQRYYDLSISPLHDRRGSLTGRLVVLRDIAERKRVEEGLRLRAVQLQVAAEVARVATSVLNLDQLLHQVAILIGERFDLYHAGLFLLDETGRWAEYRAGVGQVGDLLLEQGFRLEVGGHSMVGWCTAHAQPRVALEVSQDAVHFDHPLLPETRSEVALPLTARGRVIGALDVQSAKKNAFPQESVTVLQIVADQLAIAIDNVRLFAEVQESLAEAQAVYRHYLREAWAGFTAAHVPAAGYRYAAGDVEPDPDAWLPGMAVAQRQSQVVITLDDDGVATFSLPITLRGEIIGVLGFKKDGEGEWTDDDVAVAQAAADQVALSLENVRLFDEVRRRARHESLVRELSDRMRRTTDMDTILETAVQELGKAMGSAHAFARLDVPEEWTSFGRGDGGSVEGDAS